MEAVYDLLASAFASNAVDFSLVTTFNLDEYIGLAPNHPNSYHAYMQERFFRRVNLRQANCHIPDGTAVDIDQECQDYERTIKLCGGIDLQLLGLGRAGHIGFNEPLSALLSRTRPKALAPVTIEQNAVLFGDPAMVPRRAITVGIGTILESKRCLMLVTGKEKASVLARAVEGPISSMISASALQLHPHCTVIVDEEAANELQGKEYYRRIFQSEPEWEPYR
jgi:glucosamine-6-phosphate deaminase